jgi:hypothetical protein
VAISSIVFACVFGGALLGTMLCTVLPEHHLSAESKDLVKLGMGLMATMAALVLGLLIASAKSSYDAQTGGLTHLSANTVFLDRVMSHYGPQTKDARDLLRRTMMRTLHRVWPESSSSPVQLEPTAESEGFYDKILELSPQNDAQHLLQNQALTIIAELGRERWLLFVQRGHSIPIPFLVLLVFWVAVIFVSFGLFAPPNSTAIATLFVCALSVSGAIFLILELDHPFEGLIKISSAPLHNALSHLGQ